MGPNRFIFLVIGMFVAKKDLIGRWVAIFDRVRADRDLRVNEFQTRCVVAGNVHEFIICANGSRNVAINNVGYLGFGEFLMSGVIAVGDELWLGGNRRIGRLLGFDDTHMPNHQNIIFQAEKVVTGADMGLVIDEGFNIRTTLDT
jgi:hypothetical protein